MEAMQSVQTVFKHGETFRKYHGGAPDPNDRGRFTQWFGSSSLMSTLYVSFPACWAPMVSERLFSWSPPSKEFICPPSTSLAPNSQRASGSNDAIEVMEETESTEVKYKIRQWSLPSRCLMLVVESSSLNWMTKLSWL